VEVPLERFLLTWKGRLVEERSSMNPRRAISLGLGLAGGPQLQAPGPFCLGLDWVKAVRASGALEPRNRSRDFF
jgi:NADH dehydrogenase [ubiquinone] 1 alpha subcomplex assembly factor 1